MSLVLYYCCIKDTKEASPTFNIGVHHWHERFRTCSWVIELVLDIDTIVIVIYSAISFDSLPPGLRTLLIFILRNYFHSVQCKQKWVIYSFRIPASWCTFLSRSHSCISTNKKVSNFKKYLKPTFYHYFKIFNRPLLTTYFLLFTSFYQ